MSQTTVHPQADPTTEPAPLLAPVPDATVAAGLLAPRRLTPATWIDRGVVALLTAAGLLCPQGAAVFYRSLLVGFAGIAGVVLAGAWIVTVAGERSPRRLQGPRRLPALLLRATRDTALAAWIAACLLAWPLARLSAGAPTGLTWSLAQAGGAARTVLQTAAAVLLLDAWLYWKHRLLHTRWLFPFHRAHHVYRDPTALAGFAVGPLESLLTFWPVVLVAVPQAVHWAPLYFALVAGFVLLNFYLHAGVSWRVLEATLPRIHVNTSVFHDRHHANAEVNFGEALTLWDRLCKTRESDRR